MGWLVGWYGGFCLFFCSSSRVRRASTKLSGNKRLDGVTSGSGTHRD